MAKPREREGLQSAGHSKSKLLELLGVAAFYTLQEHFGGSHVYVPKADIRLRNEAILATFDLHIGLGERPTATVELLAERYGLSPRQVYRVLRRRRR